MGVREDRVKETWDVYQKFQQNLTETAEEMNLAVSTVSSRIDRARILISEGRIEEAVAISDIEFPDLPPDDIPIEELIDQLCVRYDQRKEVHDSRQWMKFKVKVPGPFGLAFFGDPHMDDNGCNWPLLRRDMDLLKSTSCLWGVGMGDYTNNWAGRLAEKVYPDQEVTRMRALKLAEWFFGQKKDDGTPAFMILIKGNHDMWSGSRDPLDWMERGPSPLLDWEATIMLVCKNKREIPIHIAHDFKGSSIYNPLHGPMRKGKFNGQAELYICGDKHNWAIMEVEDEERPGYVYWAARARGYKFMDSYAQQLGFGDQQYGATITAIIDPDGKGPNAIRCYPDMPSAVEFLNYLRAKYEG